MARQPKHSALLRERDKLKRRITKLNTHKPCGRQHNCECRQCLTAIRSSYLIEVYQPKLQTVMRKLENGEYEEDERNHYAFKLKRNLLVVYRGVRGMVTTVIDDDTCLVSIPGEGEIAVSDARNELTLPERAA